MLKNITTIRQARPEDASSLAILMTELGYPTSPGDMSARLAVISMQKEYKLFVFEAENQILGLAGAVQGWYFEQNGCYVRLLALITKDGYRKQGIGKALTKAVEDWAIELGARAMVLNCGNRPERAAAHTFYSRLGYTVRSTGYSKNL